MDNPIFFEMNKIDLSLGSIVSITVTDAVATDTGSDIVDYMRNRKLSDGWITTDSTDAANTTLVVDFGESHDVTDIFLIQHNLKAYTIQYWNGSSYTDFSTAISESSNTDVDKRHSFNTVNTDKIQIVITGTMTADDDKIIRRLFVGNYIGQLTTGFKIDDVENNMNRRVVRTLSGKVHVTRNVGAFECTLSKNNVTNDNDLYLVETLFDYYNGFTIWLCGDNVSQFSSDRVGWRYRDLYTVLPINEYTPQWDDGFYDHGMNVKMKLVEAI